MYALRLGSYDPSLYGENHETVLLTMRMTHDSTQKPDFLRRGI